MRKLSRLLGVASVARRDAMTGANAVHERRLRLHSATIMVCEAEIEFLAFHASMAMDREEVVQRLVARYGTAVAAEASVRVGFDPSHPLLSPEVARLLTAAGGEVMPIEQRIDVSFERRIVR